MAARGGRRKTLGIAAGLSRGAGRAGLDVRELTARRRDGASALCLKRGRRRGNGAGGRLRHWAGSAGVGRPSWALFLPQLLFLLHFLQTETWRKRKKGVDREFDRDKNILGVLETCTV